MNTSKTKTATDQGSVSEKNLNDAPVPEITDIEKWLADDINRAMSLLQAISTDFDLRRSMATFMQGRIINARNQEAIRKSNQVPSPIE